MKKLFLTFFCFLLITTGLFSQGIKYEYKLNKFTRKKDLVVKFDGDPVIASNGRFTDTVWVVMNNDSISLWHDGTLGCINSSHYLMLQQNGIDKLRIGSAQIYTYTTILPVSDITWNLGSDIKRFKELHTTSITDSVNGVIKFLLGNNKSISSWDYSGTNEVDIIYLDTAGIARINSHYVGLVLSNPNPGNVLKYNQQINSDGNDGDKNGRWWGTNGYKHVGYTVQNDGTGTADNIQFKVNKGSITSMDCDTVASASTITLDSYNNFVISGTADVDSINTASEILDFTIIYIEFSGTKATNGMVDGKNLKLSATFAYTPDDMIVLQRRGNYWFEISRSAN